MPHLYVKDESLNPTGSFKARGLCLAVSRARELGVSEVVIPSAGNAASAMAADAATAGMRVPSAVGGFLILSAVRESGGTAIAVSDDALLAGQRRLATLEGIFAYPEGGATLAALERLLDRHWIRPDERVVLFNTGTGLKYPETLREP